VIVLFTLLRKETGEKRKADAPADEAKEGEGDNKDGDGEEGDAKKSKLSPALVKLLAAAQSGGAATD